MQKFNYHCHTSFEDIFDGINTADEMLSAYEQKGFNEIGISNHCIVNPIFAKMPLMHRQNLSDINKAIDFYKRSYDYIDEAASKHHIKVRKGFEVDYFSSKEWRINFERIIKELKPEYLISATHFLRNADESYVVSIFRTELLGADITIEQKNELVRNYFKNILNSLDSGYFNFLAHFDYCCMFNLGVGSEWDEIKQEIIEKIAKNKIACEINTGGIRREIKRPFPDWSLVRDIIKHNIPVLISDDAHRIEDTGFAFDLVEEKLAEFGCKERFFIKD